MMKKLMLVMMALTLCIAFVTPDSADARRGGFKSGPRSYNPAPKKSTTTDNVRKSETPTGTNKAGATTRTNTGRGFFSGGSFLKGMMIGGLAGMLFGGMFAGMGFLGNILGLAINLLAIYVIVAICISLYRRFTKRPRHDDYHRGGRY